MDTNQQINIIDYIKENIVVVAKPVHSAAEIEFFTESYGEIVQTYSTSSTQYGNHHIKRITMNGEIFSLAIIKGVFVMSLNEKQLRRCIDTFDAELPALAKKVDLHKNQKKFCKADRFFYLPVEAVRKFVTKIK